MKAMLSAFVATALIGVGAYYALQEAGYSTAQQAAGANVRLGN